MANLFGRLFANGSILVSSLDEVSYPASTKLTANTTAFYYPEFDEVTATTVPLRQQSTRLISNGIFDEVTLVPLVVTYVIVGGGGAGGLDGNDSGGGGAGGYRSSVAGELSGGNSPAESPLTLVTGILYDVTVGNGGPSNGFASSGSSNFHTITAAGGGYGAAGTTTNRPALSGGSGGGGSDVVGSTAGAAGTTGQGFAGGNFSTDGGGGGGAGHVGYDGNDATKPSDGGNGIQSNITGTPTYYAGGGGGGVDTAGRGIGGLGGGGNGAVTGVGSPGTSGTGGGGGGTGGTGAGGNGGSGVVILRYPNIYTISLTNGYTATTTNVGSDKVTVITSTDGELGTQVYWTQ